MAWDDIETSSLGSPWRQSAKGAIIVPDTPPRLRHNITGHEDSDVDELNDERIPNTSPYLTQPTQIISQRTTLKKTSPSPHTDDSIASSPPPQSNALLNRKPVVGTRDQTISKFFKRPLALSPKISASRPAFSPRAASPKVTVPMKRSSDIIELSDDDEEDDDDFGGRGTIKPTTFSRKATSTSVSPEKQPTRQPKAKKVDFSSFKYSGNSNTKTQNHGSRKQTKGRIPKPEVISVPSSNSEDEVTTAPTAPRRRRLVQGRQQRDPSPPSSSQNSTSTKASTQATSPEEKSEKVAIVISSDNESENEYNARDSSPVVDDEQDGHLLKLMNELDLKDLVALTAEKETDIKVLIKKRPFASIAEVEQVAKWAEARGKKKRQRICIGEDIIEKTRLFLRAIQMVDKVVADSDNRATFIKSQISSWGMNSRGRKSSTSPELAGDKAQVKKSTARTAKKAGNTSKFAHTQPSYMNPELPMHDFQIFGVNWMNLLFSNGYGGILADDMGLGKTCQVIGLMARMQDDWEGDKLEHRPFPNLVVVPPSTLDNWMAEFKKFAPELEVVKYSGSQSARMEIAEELADDPESYHVVVTSYSQLGQLEDVSNLNSLGINAAIFDEAQTLKNPTTNVYKRLMRLRTQWRLLLSGTPIQNHLMEMISMLSFVDPELFRDRMEDIQYVFDHKIHSKNLSNTALLYGERVDRARSILEPFILQRRKDQVGQNLPPKTHTIIRCDLPDDQKTLYDQYEAHFRAEPSQRGKGGIAVRGNDMNNVWMQLKKAALHLQLFRRHFTDTMVEEMAQILFTSIPHRDLDLAEPKFHLLLDDLKSRSDFDLHLYCQDFPGLLKKFDIPEGSWTESGKVKKLLELVDSYKQNGDRVLVFSKFTKVVEILSYAFHHEGIEHCMLTGDKLVGERQAEINRFQNNKDITVFLLTTGAGGTGINLTAANKVIIFDMSSNPQDDKQAENRAHRLGQTRPVEIIHLLASDTVEDLIYQTCQKKIELANKVTNTNSDDESHVRATVREILQQEKGRGH